jgi:hypothetical protein
MNRSSLATRSVLVVGAVLLVLMAGLAIVRLWSHVVAPDWAQQYFGLDLGAYLAAAQRLIETGSPYHPRLLEGPIANVAANVAIAYYYPPPLAQAFVPLVGVSHWHLAVVWALAQLAAFVILIPRLYVAGGGRLHPMAWLGLAFLLIGSWPLNLALYIGNVSGWVAIVVGVMLLGPARLAGAAAGLAAIVKMTPAPLLAVALIDRSTRRTAFLVAAGITLASLVIAPAAWVDWLRVLPVLAQLPPAPGYTNLAPVETLLPFGFGTAGALLGWTVAIGFGLLAIWSATREGVSLRSVGAATVSMLFLSSTLWFHYLAALVPLIAFLWPRATGFQRAAIVAYLVWGLSMWVASNAAPPAQVVSLVTLLALAVALVLPTRSSVASEPAGLGTDPGDGRAFDQPAPSLG